MSRHKTIDATRQSCYGRARLRYGRGAATIAVWVIATAISYAADSPPMGVQIASWAELERELAKPLSLETPPDYGLKKSPTFRSILDRGNKSLWLEMLNQQDHPVVVLAGFVGIIDKHPEKSFEFALRSIGHKRPGSSVLLYFPMMKCLQQADPSPENLKTFSAVSETLEVNSKAGTIWILGGGLRYSFLYKWFDNRASDDAPWSVRAFVLDRLYGDAQEQHVPITARMRESLEAAAGVPGLPSQVFLTHTQRLDEDFSKMVLQTLADPSIDDLAVYPILINHLSFVREHSNELRALKLSERRKQTVESAIEKSTHEKE